MKLTITRIARFTKKKDGTPLTTSTGKPYTSVRFQANEYGQRWISGFGNQENSGWKEGDTVDVEVEEKGEYLNFSMPKRSNGSPITDADRYLWKQASESAYAANLKLDMLIRELRSAGVIKDPSKVVGNTDIPYPENPRDGIADEDLPF